MEQEVVIKIKRETYVANISELSSIFIIPNFNLKFPQNPFTDIEGTIFRVNRQTVDFNNHIFKG